MALTARELVEQLAGGDIQLAVINGQLRYEAPKGAVTSELLAELRQNKAALIGWLSAGRDANLHAPSTPSKSFSIAGTRPSHAPLVDPLWTSDHAYFRYVEPFKGNLLNRLKLDKCYTKAQGVWMFERNGTRILDALSQYGALPFGHNPPEIWDAIAALRDSGEPAFAANSALEAAGELAERLIHLWPEAGFENVVFTNSGTEAIEAAIKLCRSASGRQAILYTSGAFHGLTLGALSVCGSTVYREGFVSQREDAILPYGDITALERTLKSKTGHFAAFVVEPIQGEAGIIMPPDDYLLGARQLCDETGTLLILDEVQTGLGRTGDLFAAQHSGVVPDVMTLAKALGGGLVPIGACLYRPTARSEHFGLRHSSTFAGGAIACRAGLAFLDKLMADGGALIGRVAENGAYLRDNLKQLGARYPEIVTAVRGRGYLQGLQLSFENYWRTPGLLGFVHNQNVLIHLMVSHLLNVGHVRIAPSFSAGDVLRIQPPLTAERAHLDLLISALDSTLAAVSTGDTFELTGHLVSEEPTAEAVTIDQMPTECRAAAERKPSPKPRAKVPGVGRFALTVHPLSVTDFERFDPVVRQFSPRRAQDLLSRFADFIDPQPVEGIELCGAGEARAYGELILIPYTPAELLYMPLTKALQEVELAVRVAQDRGAEVVGLGGFTSIITQGGLALSRRGLPPLTSGNSFTSTATKQALLAACAHLGVDANEATVAVVGAGGMIGRTISFLLAQHFSRMVLVGNTARQVGYRARGEAIAQDLILRLQEMRHLNISKPHSFAEYVANRPEIGRSLIAHLELSGRLVIGQELDVCLPEADAIALATSSLETFLQPKHIKRNAIVCDVSRPFNVDPTVQATRPDVTLIEGGLVHLPPHSDISFNAGPRPGLVYACAAETMLWALERAYERVSPDGCMEISSVLDLEALGYKHGFRVDNTSFAPH